MSLVKYCTWGSVNVIPLCDTKNYPKSYISHRNLTAALGTVHGTRFFKQNEHYY